MGTKDSPVMPNYKLRPHEANSDYKPTLATFLRSNGGIVIYAHYPNEQGEDDLVFVPLTYPTTEELPPDDYVWEGGTIVTTADGRKVVAAPPVRITETGLKLMAIDAVLPDMELLPYETEEHLLDRVFKWV